jgi:putative transposase
MARQLRVQQAGAIYHVLNRGDRRELIFRDAPDRQRFLDTLAEVRCARWLGQLCLRLSRSFQTRNIL